MSLNRWKLVAGVLGLGMCGIAALAEPACRNTAPVNARMPDEKKPEVPLKGSKSQLELPKLPDVTPPAKGDEGLPIPGPNKIDFPAVGELPRVERLVNTKDETPQVSKLPDVTPLPTVSSLPDSKLPIPPLKMNDPVKIADEFSKLPPVSETIPAPKVVTGHKLENGTILIEKDVNLLPPPATFIPPPITPVVDTRPVPTKPLTAAIDPAPVPATIPPPQLTPRVVVEEPTPLRPVSVEKKLRVQLNLGHGKPWLEIRDNEELVLKVVAEAVEVKAVGEGTEGLNVLKATGGVTFRTLGGNGTCDELRVVPGTGEVQLSGKVVVTSNWGKAETTATAEKMTFRLGSEPTGKK